MKTKLIAFAFALLLPLLAQAGVPLKWTASPSTNVTYVVYGHTNTLTATNLASAGTIFSAGTNQAAVAYLSGPGPFWFTVTARDSLGAEVPSNIIKYTPPGAVVLSVNGAVTNASSVSIVITTEP